MPDDRDLRSRPPGGWGDAFATLPLEAPDSGGWQRLERALPRRNRVHRPAWAGALVAVLAVVALLPTWMSRQAEPVDAVPVPAADTAASPATVAPAPRIASQPSPASVRPDVRQDDAASRPLPADPRSASTATNTSRRSGRVPDPATGSISDPDRTRATPDTPLADSDMPRIGQAVATADPSNTAELDRLYAESAQLEALLAMARDERVSSGTAAALASEFDAQVASIDATLIQPGVTPQQRAALWRDRVDALRQVAAFESTQRLLAAQGERYDAMLVSVD